MQGKDMMSLPSGSGNIEDNGIDCWIMRQANIRPCSVRLKRYQPSPGLFWEVEKVEHNDETVLHYNGVVIKEISKGNSEVKSQKKTRRDLNSRRRAKLIDQVPVVGVGERQIKVMDVNHKELFSCPKCDKKFRKRWDMRKHAVFHFRNLFYELLPDKEPFSCPVCQMICSRKQTLMRHYALGHKKVLQLTDLTPEDLKFTRQECEVSARTDTEENRLKELLSQYTNVVAYSKQE